MPEEAVKTYETSEKDGRYAPIQTDPENDVIQIHKTEKCLRVRILKINIGGQTETPVDRIDTVAYLIKENFGYEKSCLFYRPNLEPNKGYTQADFKTDSKRRTLTLSKTDLYRTSIVEYLYNVY